MKRLFTLISLVSLGIVSATAQNITEGYYRVYSGAGDHYFSIVNNKIDDKNKDAVSNGGGGHVYSLRLKPLEEAISDPGTVIKVKQESGGLILEGQGINTYRLTSLYLQAKNNIKGKQAPSGSYWLYGSKSGATRYIFDSGSSYDTDKDPKGDKYRYTYLYAAGEQSTGNYTLASKNSNWYFQPINNDDSYFAITPETDIKVNGKYYTTIYCTFPFKVGENMKAYYIKECKAGAKEAKMIEIASGNVPANTPVIIESISDKPADNKVTLISASGSISGNILKGELFSYVKMKTDAENENTSFDDLKNVVTYKASTMRVLGVSDGKLALVKASDSKLHVTKQGKYLRANKAYLELSGAAENITLVKDNSTPEEEEIIITAKSVTREYGEKNPTFEFTAEGGILEGTPEIECAATESSPAGTYEIIVKAGSVKNPKYKLVNGTLTVSKAILQVSVADAEREEGEENPEFAISYKGWKLNEDESVLTTKPTATTKATKNSAAGVYDIVVSGGVAQNYEFKYVNGKLTVKGPFTIAAKSYTRKYGEPNPKFEFITQNGVLQGTPEIECEATEKSPVGTYDIVVKIGSVTNEKTKLINGTLTIEKAPLNVTVANVEREEGQENPEFTITYSGWKLDEDESVLTKKPTATTKATKDSPAGEYDIVLSGGEAKNYAFNYVNGKLTITKKAPESIEENGITYTVEKGTNNVTVSKVDSNNPVCNIPATVTFDGVTYNVTAIAAEAFKNMTNIMSITIPESIRSIGEKAFAGCTSLKEIICNILIPLDLNSADGSTIFEGVDKETCKLYVPDNSVDAYKAAPIWSEFKNIVGISTLGINNIKIEGKTITIYNVNGQKVNAISADELPHGLYIINGKKVIK